MKVITASRQCLKAVITNTYCLLDGTGQHSVMSGCSSGIRPSESSWLSFLFLNLLIQVIQFIEVVRVLTMRAHRLVNLIKTRFDLSGG